MNSPAQIVGLRGALLQAVRAVRLLELVGETRERESGRVLFLHAAVCLLRAVRMQVAAIRRAPVGLRNG